MRSHAGCSDVRRPGQGGHQHPLDQYLGDQDLLRSSSRSTRELGVMISTRPSASTGNRAVYHRTTGRGRVLIDGRPGLFDGSGAHEARPGPASAAFPDGATALVVWSNPRNRPVAPALRDVRTFGRSGSVAVELRRYGATAFTLSPKGLRLRVSSMRPARSRVPS
jgi:hypothetical protein